MKQLHTLIMTITLGCLVLSTFSQNPFFQYWDTPYQVPPFENITANHCREAFLKAMQEQVIEVNAIISQEEIPTFENTLVTLDRSGSLMRKVSSVFFGMVAAHSTPELLALQTEITPLLTKHQDHIMMNEELFQRIQQVYDHYESFNLNREEIRLLFHTYNNFVRGGALLSESLKEKFKQVNEEIATLQTRFGQNLLIETGAYRLIVDKESDLKGLPPDLIAEAAQRAKKAGMHGQWIFGLDNPSIMPFLHFSENRSLRKQIFQAYLNRCNNNNDKDNKELIKRLILLRHNKVLLLGYPDFATYALYDRMAKTPQAVYQLLDQLWIPALNKAKIEASEMQTLTGSHFRLESWDWRYYSEKIRQQKYDLSDDMLRPYFTSDQVRDGIFWVCNQLYGITFTEVKHLPKPHPDAQTFLCKDVDGTTELGILYLDLFARPGFKRGGAWCGSYRSQCYDDNERVKPITTIVCNFANPVDDQPALLTLDEVTTFFHEFGHALHNLFKDIHFYGTATVPRDFVELPSKFMENWAFQPQVLKQYALHYQTGKSIPQYLIDKIIASVRYGQGFATTEYLAASYLDMDYHVMTEPQELDVLSFESSSLENRGLIPQIPPRYRSTYFQHTMTGGYTAGYYSYIWSEMLDADGFKAFEETGNLFDRELALRFRRFILEPGCIDDPMDMYFNFRQKQPTIDALLEKRGLK